MVGEEKEGEEEEEEKDDKVLRQRRIHREPALPTVSWRCRRGDWRKVRDEAERRRRKTRVRVGAGWVCAWTDEASLW